MDTANSAISSVITTIDAIQAAITGASNPGASFADINTNFRRCPSQLDDAINGASFNGVNLLNGTQADVLRRRLRRERERRRDQHDRLHGPSADRRHRTRRPPEHSADGSGQRHQLRHDARGLDRRRHDESQRHDAYSVGGNSPVTTTDNASDSIVSTYTGYTSYNTTTGEASRRRPTRPLRRPRLAPTCGRSRQRRRPRRHGSPRAC